MSDEPKGISQAQSGWISTRESLPDPGQLVIVHAPLARRHADRFGVRELIGTSGANLVGAVTHWMPLPEPPKESA